jgi:hypothetical protein
MDFRLLVILSSPQTAFTVPGCLGKARIDFGIASPNPASRRKFSGRVEGSDPVNPVNTVIPRVAPEPDVMGFHRFCQNAFASLWVFS